MIGLLNYKEDINKSKLNTNKDFSIIFKVSYLFDDVKLLNQPIYNTFKIEVYRNVNLIDDHEVFGVYETTSIVEIKKILKSVINADFEDVGHNLLFINAFPEQMKGIWLGDNFNAKRYAKVIYDSILNEDNVPNTYSIETLSKMKKEFIEKHREEITAWFDMYVQSIDSIEKPKKKKGSKSGKRAKKDN